MEKEREREIKRMRERYTYQYQKCKMTQHYVTLILGRASNSLQIMLWILLCVVQFETRYNAHRQMTLFAFICC